LSGWYVEPKYSFYSTLLEKAATKSGNVSYINTSARPNTHKIIQAQGFQKYSRGQFLIPTLLNLSRGGGVEIQAHECSSPAFGDTLERDLMTTHAKYGCICLWGLGKGDPHPFVFRRKKLKGFVPAVQLIFCRGPEDVAAFIGPLSRHLLSRGVLFISVDANGPIPGLAGAYFEGLEPRFYKGVPLSIGDLAYTLNAISPIVRRQRNLSR
jgi:hypothetical protein